MYVDDRFTGPARPVSPGGAGRAVGSADYRGRRPPWAPGAAAGAEGAPSRRARCEEGSPAVRDVARATG